MIRSVGLVVRDSGTMGGLARYAHELAAGIAASGCAEGRAFVVGPVRSAWPLPVTALVERAGPLGGSRPLLGLRGAPVDLIHFVSHETTPVFALLDRPVVMTIHSVEPMFLPIEEVLSEASVGARAAWHLPFRMLRAVRRRLALVVVPSLVTAEQVAEHLRVPAERIRVIPHGVSFDFGAVREPGEGAPAVPYVLSVAHHQPQKNVVRLIEAFARAGLDDHELVVAGDPRSCRATYEAAVARQGLAGRVRLIGAVEDDALLARLYRGATLLAIPSLHESFGLPALEAMACGCPVVASRGTGVGETVGDGGILVDPRDCGDIAGALGRIAGDAALRDELAGRALDRASGFTWRRSVDAHLAAYAEVVG